MGAKEIVRILKLLGERPYTVSELARKLNVSRQAITRTLRQADKRGLTPNSLQGRNLKILYGEDKNYLIVKTRDNMLYAARGIILCGAREIGNRHAPVSGITINASRIERVI